MRLRSYLVLTILSLCGCEVPQPAPTPATSNEPPAITRPRVTVMSGKLQRIDFISVVHADCTSAGYVTGRIITAPAHGELTMEPGVDYPAYPKNNQRYQCNLRQVPVTNIYYRSSPGYVGDDTATFEWISPIVPTSRTNTYMITVR
jgi:hypothetical protein